jgi:hypothetical protein
MTRQRRVWVSVGCVLALITFWFPWVTMRGFFNSTDSGWTLAKVTESAASGNSLALLWVCPAAVLAILILALTKAPARNHAIAQIVLAIVAFLPIPLTLPAEIDKWGGGDVSYGWGLYLFGVVLVVLLIEAVQRLRSEPTPAST